MMSWDEFQSNMKSVAFLQREIKRKTMMFHVTHKEEMAVQFGLPVWAFHHIPFNLLNILEDEESAMLWWGANRKATATQEVDSVMRTHFSEASAEQRDGFETWWRKQPCNAVEKDVQSSELKDSDTTPAVGTG